MSQAARQITGKFLNILKIGHPRLVQVAKEVADVKASHIQSAIKQMLYTFKHSPEFESRLGVAANQFDLELPINQTPKIFLARLPKLSPHPRYDEIWKQNQITIPLSVIVNPKITPTTDEKILAVEPCASLPKIKAAVLRWKSINCTYWDENGEVKSLDLDGLGSILFQHERDHLDGILASHVAEYIVNEETGELIPDYNPQEIEFVEYIMGNADFNPDFFIGS